MAIVENVTTTTPTTFTPPFWRKVGLVFIKWIDDTSILVVDTTEGIERVYQDGFPNSDFQTVRDTEASTEVEFDAALSAVQAIHSAL
jgi:hypothetical protein